MNRDLFFGVTAGLGLLAAILSGAMLIVIGDTMGHAISVSMHGMGWL